MYIIKKYKPMRPDGNGAFGPKVPSELIYLLRPNGPEVYLKLDCRAQVADQKYLWNLTIRLRGQEVPLEDVCRALWPRNSSET